MAKRNINDDVSFFLGRCSLAEREIYETLEFLNREADRIMGPEETEQEPKSNETQEKDNKQQQKSVSENLYPLSLTIDELQGEMEEQEMFRSTVNRMIDIRVNALKEKIKFMKKKSKK